MKRVLTLVLLVTGLFVSGQSVVHTEKDSIKFDTKEIFYGYMEPGEDGKREFSFTNYSSHPIMVMNVSVTCGCTVPSWTREPILPGEKGSIVVEYDTKRMGGFYKKIKVKFFQVEGSYPLVIRGAVVEDKSKYIPLQR
jgi:hypothetical protein